MKIRVCLRFFVHDNHDNQVQFKFKCAFCVNAGLRNKTFNSKLDINNLYPHCNGVT